jgi:hypothetical protein
VGERVGRTTIHVAPRRHCPRDAIVIDTGTGHSELLMSIAETGERDEEDRWGEAECAHRRDEGG